MKDNYQPIYNTLHEIYQLHLQKNPKNTDSKQMCCMWSTINPPDQLEYTAPIVDIENAFDISLDEDSAITLYDLNLDQAALFISKMKSESDI